MKTTERFDNAVTKLYNAFHYGELNFAHPCHCAVGNICNNNNNWFREVQRFKDNIFSSVSNPNYKTKNHVILSSGYSVFELGEVERIFGEHAGTVGRICKYKSDKSDSQFGGLCAVIEYLCKLDGIPNFMDYTKLFETENEKPKYQLS